MSDWQKNKEARSLAYAEKRKDPRWQKLRLQIMERDGWACQICFNDEETLNVHHLYYENEREPWDYDTEALVTLCQTCHTDETESRPAEEKFLLYILKRKGFMSGDLEKLVDGFATLADGMVFMPGPDIIRYALSNPDMQTLLHDRYFAHLAARQKEQEEQAAITPVSPKASE